MKRLRLLCVLFLGLLFVAKAQNIDFGTHLGLSISPLSNKQPEGRQFGLGLMAGFTSDIKIKEKLSFSPEINYSSIKHINYYETTDDRLLVMIRELFDGEIGSFFPDTFNINDFINIDSLLAAAEGNINDTVYGFRTQRHNLSYIEIPLLFSYKINKVKISFGPYAGILVGSTTKEYHRQEIPLLEAFPGIMNTGDPFTDLVINATLKSKYPGYNNTRIETVTSPKFELLDYGLVLQLAAQIDNNFFCGLRYAHGFREYLQDVSDKKGKNSSLRFTLGYMIGKTNSSRPVYQ